MPYHGLMLSSVFLMVGMAMKDQDLPDDNPLLSTEKWLAVLKDTGFTQRHPLSVDQFLPAWHRGKQFLWAVDLWRKTTPIPLVKAAGIANLKSLILNSTLLNHPELTREKNGLRTALCQLIAGELQPLLSLETPPSFHRPLQEFGLGSLLAVELCNRLSRRLNLPLSTTVVFDYPTVQALGQCLP